MAKNERKSKKVVFRAGAEFASRDFWENDLQMDVNPWLAWVQDKSSVRGWVEERSKRQLNVLCDCLGLDGARLQDQRDGLIACDGQLTPYFLVDRFAYRRSKFAAADYATTKLSAELIELCRIDADSYDTDALLFALYRLDPVHLVTVYHLEKLHTTGFARMKLKGDARKPNNKTFEQFLTPSVVERVLSQFDAKRRDGRISEFKNIVRHRDHHLLFVRREERRSMLLRSGRPLFGFRPEWIVLDFRDNGRRVDIASISMSIPLEIANGLAAAYFRGDCEYENEMQVTYRPQIDKFLEVLTRDGCDFLKLVEISVKNSPLDGAPTIKISSEDGESIAESVRHFEKSVGRIIDDVDMIKSIKGLYSGKRVKLLFQRVPDVKDGYDVRYTDNVLNARERRTIEAKLREEPHGLRVLSTEKRHKQ